MATNDIYSLADLLQFQFTPAQEFGYDNIVQSLERHVAFLNAEVDDMLGPLTETSTQRRRVWGNQNATAFVEVRDDIASKKGERVGPGVEINFPLRKFSGKTGWSNEWVKRATVADFAKKFNEIQTGYLLAQIKELQFSLYSSGNYTYKDWLKDDTSLAVKAFLNADSAAIPPAPDGTTFTGSSHKHYVGTVGAALAYTDIDTLIANVREHGFRGLTLFVNSADVSVLAALASTKLTKLTHAAVAIPGLTSGTVATDDPANDDENNKLVGYWDGIPVRTKPWAIDNYIACGAMAAPEKPLVRRVEAQESLRGLIAEVPYGLHPINAQEYVSYFGFGAWNRAGFAFLDTATQTNYTDPTSLIR